VTSLEFPRSHCGRGFYYPFFFVPVGTMPRMAGHVAFMPATLHEAVPRRMADISAAVVMAAVGMVIAMLEMVATGMDVGTDMPMPAFMPRIVPVVAGGVGCFGGGAQPYADIVVQPAMASFIIAIIPEIFRERLGGRDRSHVQGGGVALALAIPAVHPVLDLAHAVTVIDGLFLLILLIVLVVHGCPGQMDRAKRRGVCIIRLVLAVCREGKQAHEKN